MTQRSGYEFERRWVPLLSPFWRQPPYNALETERASSLSWEPSLEVVPPGLQRLTHNIQGPPPAHSLTSNSDLVPIDAYFPFLRHLCAQARSNENGATSPFPQGIPMPLVATRFST